MKTINSKSSKTERQCSFIGVAKLYDSSVYIDTRDGTGYDAVIKKMQPIIHKLSLKYRFNGNSIEDTRQDIIVHILEILPKYDPNKNTKLSSFLQTSVNRRLINKLRDSSCALHNATFLNIRAHNIACLCGFVSVEILHRGESFECPRCGRVSFGAKKFPMPMDEIPISAINMYDENGTNETNFDFYETLADNFKDDSALLHDLRAWLKKEDPEVVKLITLICFKDYSIPDAAKEVGLSAFWAKTKIKRLRRKSIVRELLGR